MPARSPYYGWFVLLVAAAAMVGTLPGRTQGLGLITEPLLADLKITRVQYAQLNLWATLIGSAGAIGVGRLIDQFGSRSVLTVVATSLAAVVLLMSRVTSFTALAIAITLTRALGQSALSVVSLAMVGQWFVRRINAAMAIYSVVMSIGFMIAFPLVGFAVQFHGWRQAWFAVGIAILAGLAPLAWLVVRKSPESIGLVPDGLPTPDSRRSTMDDGRSTIDDAVGYTLRAALVTPAFWVFAIGAALYGLVASGIGLFNESILIERGFGPNIYYQTLVVTAMTGLAGNFLGGWLANYVALNRLMAISLFVLTGGLVALPHIGTHAMVMVWAACMGLGGGLVMVLFFSVWPRVYGRRQLGRIQGVAQALTVLASALGPLLLATCVAWTGSYRAMFYILAAIIGLFGLAALAVPMPEPNKVEPH
jgi:MFS family permease